MSRPDPTTVSRRPMARAQGKIAVSGPREAHTHDAWLFDDRQLNLDTLHRLVEAADVVSEGRVESLHGQQRFFGSTILTFDLARASIADHIDERIAQRLVDALTEDRRAQRVIDARVFRELARLLGTETSVDFEAHNRTVHSGTVIRVVADFESPLSRVDLVAH
jgi:hypothetical protein